MPNSATKHDQEKIRTDLLPPGPLFDIARVLAFGANKYGDRNWEEGFNYGRVYGALLRHMLAWWAGENNDPETGLSHLSHAGCCLLFLLEFANHSHAGIDDRPAIIVGPQTDIVNQPLGYPELITSQTTNAIATEDPKSEVPRFPTYDLCLHPEDELGIRICNRPKGHLVDDFDHRYVPASSLGIASDE